jgi:hypothetical protein
MLYEPDLFAITIAILGITLVTLAVFRLLDRDERRRRGEVPTLRLSSNGVTALRATARKCLDVIQPHFKSLGQFHLAVCTATV